jgi:hypothetical protein
MWCFPNTISTGKKRIIEDQYPVERFVLDLLEGKASTSYGSWFENVSGWLVARHGRPDFLLLRYEDLLSNTVSELRKDCGIPERFYYSQKAGRSSGVELRRADEKA